MPGWQVHLMSRWAKVALVCAGYLLALVAGGVASYMYNARVSALPYDTSGGMYAAGEFMSGLSAFFMVALMPTLLMLWFLRRNWKLWQAIALASFGFASVGLLAVQELNMRGRLERLVFLTPLALLGFLLFITLGGVIVRWLWIRRRSGTPGSRMRR